MRLSGNVASGALLCASMLSGHLVELLEALEVAVVVVVQVAQLLLLVKVLLVEMG